MKDRKANENSSLDKGVRLEREGSDLDLKQRDLRKRVQRGDFREDGIRRRKRGEH